MNALAKSLEKQPVRAKVEARYRAVLNLLSQRPCTVVELIDILNLTKPTAYRTIYDLEERKLIRQSGFLGAQLTYEVVREADDREARMPVLYNAATRQALTAMDLTNVAGNESNTQAARAAMSFFGRIANLLMLAGFDDEDAEDLQSTLNTMRQEHMADARYVRNLANMMDQMTKDPRWWDVVKLREIPKDASYDYIIARERYIVSFYKKLRDFMLNEANSMGQME